jgi:hypothetical protein
MYIVWDKFDNAPYAKDNHGHFKIYGNKKAAQSYIYRNYLTKRCYAKEVSHVAFTEGGFI